MRKEAKIYVAGGAGLVGSAIVRELKAQGFNNILQPRAKEVDLTNEAQTLQFFEKEKPEFVFMAAAKVGGIHANNTYPVEFLTENLKIELNVINAAWRAKTEKMLFLGSSCIYPKMAKQPIPETELLNGHLESTNNAYAIAKITGILLCQSYHRQYGSNFISAMPTNLYGINDNYHPENSHVIPGLIRRFHEAKMKNASEVVVWGTGKPMREFLFADDVAKASLFLMNNYNDPSIINIGSDDEVTIGDLAKLIAETVGFKGKLVFDPSKPDGTPRKKLDCSKIFALGWKPSTHLKQGLQIAYQDFLKKV